MLHQVSFQTVHRSEPATADLAVIRIETLVHIHMPSEAYPIGESLSTLTTMMSQISQSRQLVLIHPLAYDVTAWNTSSLRLGIYMLRLGIYWLRLGIYRRRLGTLNICGQSSPSPWPIWQVRQVNKVSKMFEFAKSHG